MGRLNEIFNQPSEGGYDKAEVDAVREEIRDTFLGASKPPDEWPTVQDLMPWPSPNKPPARSDDLRGKQFSTHRPRLRQGAG